MSDEQGAAEKLAAVLHPDAFGHRARNATGYAAKWFEAAAASAKKQAARAVAAGWIGPEAARCAKADLENAREAGKVYRRRAERAEAKVAHVEAEVATWNAPNAPAYAARIRAALGDEGSADLGT